MPLKIAYLVNQYPKPSHSFIRTEILALEDLGFAIERYSVRGWDAELVDPLDTAERSRTRYVLQRGALPLIGALLRTIAGRPVRFLSALRTAWRLSRGGERGLAIHLIYLAEACLLRLWCDRGGVDQVHAHFGSNAASVALLMRKLGGPRYSITIHGSEEFDKPLQWKLRDKIHHAAFVVAISSFCRSQVYRWADLRHWDKIAVVHCAIDPRIVQAAPTASTVPERLVCIGRLCEQKGQLLLIEALASLHRRGIAAELVLLGDGEMRDVVEAAIAAAGLGDRVTITGWFDVDRLLLELDQARAMVLPSFAEGLPVAIMEAMARRRPVISTLVAGIPELVRDEVEGLLVPAGDTAALADALERVLTMDEAAIEAMGAAASARVLQRHTAQGEAAKLARLFDQAAQRETQGSRTTTARTR